jgi:UDP-N-acetylmuramate dehydrogenase
MDFAYRKSILQDGRYILLGAEFELQKSNKEDIQTLLDRNLAFRKDVQPTLAHPNAGSVFKNPENDSAGRLLDKAGAKGFETENVKIWNKHANFIVNKGNATSIEILEMMHKMFTAVKEPYRIELQPEIILLGIKQKKRKKYAKYYIKRRENSSTLWRNVFRKRNFTTFREKCFSCASKIGLQPG